MECLDKKAKVKLNEINTVMCDVMRQDLMHDTGSSKLKNKVLDLITKLRVEASVLNPSKTGKAVYYEPTEETEKEPLGLDENGQIKLTHDAEDIKSMVN